MKRRIQAWAAVRGDQVVALYNGANPGHFIDPEAGERLANLVEHDPRADAVVRAAVKLAKTAAGDYPGHRPPYPSRLIDALIAAVERLQKGRKK